MFIGIKCSAQTPSLPPTLPPYLKAQRTDGLLLLLQLKSCCDYALAFLQFLLNFFPVYKMVGQQRHR